MSSRTSPEDDDPLFPKGSVEEAAAVWLARIDAGLSAEEAGALSVWRSRDPRHEAELAKLELIWHQIETLKPAMASAGGETSGFQTPTKPARRKTLAFPIGLMAAAALIALGLVLWQRSSGDTVTVGANSAPVNYKLTRSARLVALPDGSLVDLRGDSQIETEFTATERRVRLVRGEAYFAVTKNPDRPFLVSVGSTTVRAVGTAFDVKGGGSANEVLVTEGKVRVDRAMTRDPASPAANVAVPILVKGQLASWGPGADDRPVSVADLSETDIKVALEWRATRLTFDLTPLKDVVDAFNLYNTKKLQLGDTAVASRTVSGEFRADNLDGFVWALPAVADATIEHVGDDLIVIKSKR